MGRKSDELCWYLNKAEIFADFCNGSIYGGRAVIAPQELAEAQKHYSGNRKRWEGRRTSVTRSRDIIKLLCRKDHFIKIAVENQDRLNYCMPLRCGEYDLLEISRQVRRLREQRKREGTLKGGEEYLSGMKETDRLIPVVTVVFFHGKGKWTAARQLRDMLDMEGMDRELEKLTANYQMNVVCLEDLNEDNFKNGLRELIGLMKRRGDKEEFQKYCAENEERLRHMDADTYDVICTMLDIDSLFPQSGNLYDDEREEYDMCTAMRELIEDGEMRGREQGRKEGERRGWEQGKKEGEKRGREQGEKHGERRGREQGEKRLGLLMEKLIKDGRQEDALRASRYAAARKRLYLEYGL